MSVCEHSNSSILSVSLDAFALLLSLPERNRDKREGRERERERQEERGNTARYSKHLESVLISKEHQLQLAYFLPLSAPKFHATIPTP